MDRVAIFMILAGLIISALGIIVLGGTLIGEWFGPETRSIARNVAAGAPFFGLVLLGVGGSRSPARPTAPRIVQ